MVIFNPVFFTLYSLYASKHTYVYINHHDFSILKLYAHRIDMWSISLWQTFLRQNTTQSRLISLHNNSLKDVFSKNEMYKSLTMVRKYCNTQEMWFSTIFIYQFKITILIFKTVPLIFRLFRIVRVSIFVFFWIICKASQWLTFYSQTIWFI